MPSQEWQRQHFKEIQGCAGQLARWEMAFPRILSLCRSAYQTARTEMVFPRILSLRRSACQPHQDRDSISKNSKHAPVSMPGRGQWQHFQEIQGCAGQSVVHTWTDVASSNSKESHPMRVPVSLPPVVGAFPRILSLRAPVSIKITLFEPLARPLSRLILHLILITAELRRSN